MSNFTPNAASSTGNTWNDMNFRLVVAPVEHVTVWHWTVDDYGLRHCALDYSSAALAVAMLGEDALQPRPDDSACDCHSAFDHRLLWMDCAALDHCNMWDANSAAVGWENIAIASLRVMALT